MASLLADLRQETGLALENIRRLSRGLYPPLLESQGLTAALTAHARRLPIPVDVRGCEQRFTREIETAMYFCCVEALQNTAKHAGASQAGLDIEYTSGQLLLQLHDDGHGFDPVHTATAPASRTAQTASKPSVAPSTSPPASPEPE